MGTMTVTLHTAITDDAIDTLFREARTVVAFSDQPVDRAVVGEIFESFKYGPTMMNNFHETLSTTFPHAPNAGKMFQDREQRGYLARMNASLQMGYFIIAAHAHGLDVGPMTGYNGPAIAERFLSDGDQDLLAVVALGYADESAGRPRSPRLPFEQVVEFI